MIWVDHFDVAVRLRVIDGSTILVDANVAAVVVVDVTTAVHRGVDGRAVAKLDLAVPLLCVEQNRGVAGTLDLHKHDKGRLADGRRRVFCQTHRMSHGTANIVYKEKELIIPLYKTIVRPYLEYCIQAWRPYHKTDIDILERVQRRATKIIPKLRNISYEMHLKVCGLTTLETRRLRGDQIEVF